MCSLFHLDPPYFQLCKFEASFSHFSDVLFDQEDFAGLRNFNFRWGCCFGSVESFPSFGEPKGRTYSMRLLSLLGARQHYRPPRQCCNQARNFSFQSLRRAFPIGLLGFCRNLNGFCERNESREEKRDKNTRRTGRRNIDNVSIALLAELVGGRMEIHPIWKCQRKRDELDDKNS